MLTLHRCLTPQLAANPCGDHVPIPGMEIGPAFFGFQLYMKVPIPSHSLPSLETSNPFPGGVHELLVFFFFSGFSGLQNRSIYSWPFSFFKAWCLYQTKQNLDQNQIKPLQASPQYKQTNTTKQRQVIFICITDLNVKPVTRGSDGTCSAARSLFFDQRIDGWNISTSRLFFRLCIFILKEKDTWSQPKFSLFFF